MIFTLFSFVSDIFHNMNLSAFVKTKDLFLTNGEQVEKNVSF